MSDEHRDNLEFHIAALSAESAEARAQLESAAGRIAHLEQLMVDAQRVAGQFREENDQLRTELNRTQGAVHNLSNPTRSQSGSAKPRKPDVFHGNRTEDVEGFLVTLERYLRLSAVPPARWVDYVASFLRHQADKWYRVQLTTHGENSAFATDYRTFKTEFLRQFKPINSVLKARDQMTKLKQTASAIAYTHQFLGLKLEIPDMNEAEAKDRYMRGLKPHVFRKVRVENPTTLNETIRMAQQFDEAVFHSRQVTGTYGRSADAMELDMLDVDDPDDLGESPDEEEDEEVTLNAITRTKRHGGRNRPKKAAKAKPKNQPKYQKGNNRERSRCIQENLCFKCKKSGHRIRDCPEWNHLKAKAQ